MVTSEKLQQAFKYLWPDEVKALKELARMLPDSPIVVNIGAGVGTSGLAFMESREDLYLYTTDIQKDDSPLGCLAAERQAIINSGVKWTIGKSNVPRFYQLAMDSKQAGRLWQSAKDIVTYPEHRSVDLCFIDGDHSYEGCKGDILAWLPNIKQNGIVAIHDYHKDELYENETDYKDNAPHPQDWPGVTQAVDELLLGKYEQIMRVDSLIAFRI